MLNVPGSEIAHRIVTFQSLLAREGVDAAIIRQNADLYYFTGTVQDAHLIVPASGQPLFMVRRDVQRAEQQSPIRPVVALQTMKDLPPAVARACGDRPPQRLGMELDVLPTNAFFFYDEKLFPKQQIVDISLLVRQVRMIKSAWEIDMMRSAAGISRAVADAVPVFLREGVTELELSIELEAVAVFLRDGIIDLELSIELEAVARRAGHLGLIRLRGFNMDMYFGHILSGPDAAISSYADAPTGGPGLSPAFGQGPSHRPIGRNEVVSVDTMLSFNGYLNDQTRNFALGEPHPRLLDAYRVAQEVHARVRDLVRPGTITGELYEWIWQWVEQAGWQEFFMGNGATRVKFIGHGLGIEVDEFPFIAQGQKLPLESGMTFAFEPKFIVPELGIVGLENTYLVTGTGLQSFNSATEELLVL